MKGFNRELKGESFQTPSMNSGEDVGVPQPRDLSGFVPLLTEGEKKMIMFRAFPVKGEPVGGVIISGVFPVVGE